MKDIDIEKLEARRASLRQEFSRIGELRLGSLFFRHRRCGKKSCVCADPKHPGHGQWVVSKITDGKTVMSTVPIEKLLPQVREQLAEGRHFWRLCAEFAETSDELAQGKLRQGQAAAKATAKKGASRKSSKSNSPPKLRH
jgi:hypothetical protein